MTRSFSYASELPPQEPRRSKSDKGGGQVAADSLSVIKGEKERCFAPVSGGRLLSAFAHAHPLRRFDGFCEQTLASALLEFVKLQVVVLVS